jgi:5-hydroxyisourate hydrolase-like protein (transthyretin family)
MKKRIIKGALLPIALALFFALIALPTYAAAANNGHIYGQLLDGTNKSVPLANQTVTLQVAQGTNSKDVSTFKTDAHGNFSFTNLSTDKTLSYVVYIRYQGAQYVSSVVTLDGNPLQKVALTVYQATQNPQDIAILQANVLVREPDVERGILSVSEVFAIQNLNNHAYVGSFDASKGKPNALRFTLPQGAKNVALGKGFAGYNVIQVDRGFASDAALLPGGNEFSFSFELPYTATTYDFQYETIYPTVQLSFLVAPNLHASVNTLKSAGVVDANDHSYLVFKGTVLPARQEIIMHLEGLSLAVNASSPSYNPTTIWFIVAAVLFCALVVLIWFLYRSRRNAALTTTSLQTGREKPVLTPSQKDTKKKQTVVSREGQQEKLLQELLQLDEDYATGKLAKAVYEERRAKTKARLRTLMSEREMSKR